MNRRRTKSVVDTLGIVTLKADKTREAPEIDALLVELGNAAKAIPFYAIFPGNGEPPVTLSGLITQGQIIRQLRQAAGVWEDPPPMETAMTAGP